MCGAQASPPAAQGVPGRVKLISSRSGLILRWQKLPLLCQALTQGGGTVLAGGQLVCLGCI